MIKITSSQLCNVKLNKRLLLFSLMSSSFCRSSAGCRTAVLNFEKVFFLNDLKDTARWFLFEVELNIRLLSLSTWRTRLSFLNDQSIRLFFLNWLRTELLLMSGLNVKLPFQFNWTTRLSFLDEQRTEFLPASGLNSGLLLMSRLDIKLPFWFNRMTGLSFSDEQRTEFLSASRLSTWLLLESRLNSD